MSIEVSMMKNIFSEEKFRDRSFINNNRSEDSGNLDALTLTSGLTKEDVIILKSLKKAIAATPYQLAVDSGFIGLDVSKRLKFLRSKKFVVTRSSDNIYLLTNRGRKQLRILNNISCDMPVLNLVYKFSRFIRSHCYS